MLNFLHAVRQNADTSIIIFGLYFVWLSALTTNVWYRNKNELVILIIIILIIISPYFNSGLCYFPDKLF